MRISFSLIGVSSLRFSTFWYRSILHNPQNTPNQWPNQIPQQSKNPNLIKINRSNQKTPNKTHKKSSLGNFWISNKKKTKQEPNFPVRRSNPGGGGELGFTSVAPSPSTARVLLFAPRELPSSATAPRVLYNIVSARGRQRTWLSPSAYRLGFAPFVPKTPLAFARITGFEIRELWTVGF